MILIRLEVNTSQTVMSLIIARVFERGLDLHRVRGRSIFLYTATYHKRAFSVSKLLPVLSV